MEPHRGVSLRLIFGVATVLGIFSSFQAFNYVSLFMQGEAKMLHLLAVNLPYWYAWAVLVPGILWVARRYPFERATWRRAAAMHAAAVVVFVLAHAVMTVGARALLLAALGRPMQSWQSRLQELFFLNFDWEMMTYWTVVGLSHALDYYGKARERALAAAPLETALA